MRTCNTGFGRDRQGGVAIIFALALVPLVGMGGAAVDYSRASSMQSRLQIAADAAALAAADGREPFRTREQAGLSVLEGHLGGGTAPTYEPSITPVMERGREVAVSVAVTTAVPTFMLSAIGIRAIAVSVESRATSGNESYDITFVLDTTGSMAGARLETLKSTAVSLIDDILARRQDPQQVRVSVVPFGQYVNIGLGNRAQPWLDVQSDYQTATSRTCQMVREVVGQNCSQVWQEPEPARSRTCFDDGRAYECGSSGRPGRWLNQCTPVYGPGMTEQCRTSGGSWVRWNGCVGSRAYPHETRDSDYGIRVPGLMNVNCGSPILEPTTNLALAKSHIRSLATAGETYIPTGLIWGWRALSTHAPITARESEAGSPVRRYMVLVTDGRNTRSPTYPAHTGTDTAAADTILQTTCREMAADDVSDITLYTIAFEVTDPAVKQLLQDCSALNGGQFFDAGSAAQLNEAMREIGGRIARLRITS